MSKARIAIFPGSFDPFTLGHASIVERALPLFDEIIIAIGIHDAKRSSFTTDERLSMIEALYAGHPRVSVLAYSELTVDFALKQGAEFILRGVRSSLDYEYEKNIADVNRELSGIETILLFTEPRFAHISSSVVRELLKYGKDVSEFIPQELNLHILNTLED